MSKDEGWIELEEGFYIVEESGSAHSGRRMRQQADDNYEAVKKAFEGKIEVVDDDEAEEELSTA
jgi:hypothetical protein